MFKKLCGFFILLLLGCSATQTNTIGGYHNNMETGLSVYHQYIAYQINTAKNGELIENTIFFKIDQNEDIPSNIIRLQISLIVINPYNLEFEVWENLEFKSLETNKTYLKRKKLRHISQALPEELISIDMPLVLDIHSQVIFSVELIDKRGKKLYGTYLAKYITGSENK